MEKIKDIFDNIKDRFSNPIVFSFVCTWLILNWQITIGLLWYDSQQIAKTGCASIFEFIADKLNRYDGFWWPLLYALLYTLFMPTIKNLIRALYSWTAKWGDNWNLKILDGGKISINKYLKLRADHEKRSKILEEVIEKESTYLNDYNRVKTDLLETQTKLNEVIQRLNEKDTFIQELRDIKILQGIWENNYELPDGTKGKETVHIERDKYFIVNQFGVRDHVFDIKDFDYDNRYRSVFFVKELVNKENRSSQQHYNINRLELDNVDLLIGKENGTTKIQYKRK